MKIIKNEQKLFASFRLNKQHVINYGVCGFEPQLCNRNQWNRGGFHSFFFLIFFLVIFSFCVCLGFSWSTTIFHYSLWYLKSVELLNESTSGRFDIHSFGIGVRYRHWMLSQFKCVLGQDFNDNYFEAVIQCLPPNQICISSSSGSRGISY